MSDFDFIFNDHSPEFIAEMEERAKTALEAIGQHMEGEAKEELENSPRRIDTGLLRNSITHCASGESPAITSYTADRPNKKGELPKGTYNGVMPEEDDNTPAMYIGTNVKYAAYV